MQLLPTYVKNLNDKDLRQLAQTKIFAGACHVKLPVCPEVMKLIKEALKASSGINNTVSNGAIRVSNCLKSISFDHECEVTPSSDFLGGFMAIDFACKDRKVAIEFDGPSHFLKAIGSGKLTTQRNGRTQAKRRLLKLLGWSVISLDYREFGVAEASGNEFEYLRSEFLREGLELPLL
jgi:hypothetical protein